LYSICSIFKEPGNSYRYRSVRKNSDLVKGHPHGQFSLAYLVLHFVGNIHYISRKLFMWTKIYQSDSMFGAVNPNLTN
jgi:hypothetical protein